MSGLLIDAKPYYPDVEAAVAKMTERELREDLLRHCSAPRTTSTCAYFTDRGRKERISSRGG